VSEAQPAPRTPAPAVRAIFAAALAAYVATAAWLVWRTAILEPYSDMFDWMVRYYRFAADGDLARYLWAPHNGHHLVITFAVLLADIRLFGASGYLFLATGVAGWAATAALMGALGGEAAGPGLRLIGAGGAVALSLMGCDALDADVDINTTYVYALVFAVGAIAAAERPRAAWWARAAALALGVAAGFGSAAGLAVWPALLFAAWRRGERRWTAAVAACAVAVVAVYAIGERGLGPSGAPATTFDPLGAAMLALNYLGLPWMRGAPGLGWAIGAAVLAASLAVVVAACRSGERLTRIAAALVVFSLVTAAMAGLARSGVIAAQFVPVRYAVFLIPLHVGLWMMAAPYLRRLWLARPKPMERVALAAAGLMIVHQGVMVVYAVRTAEVNQAVISAFKRGERTPAMLITIYPDLDKAAALSARMRADGFYQRELRAGSP
jgi:hypothetical protein